MAGDNISNVGISDQEAIIAELNYRVEQFGGLTAYVNANPDVDRRNFHKYLKGRVPELTQLLRHLRNLNVKPADFFASVDARTHGTEPGENLEG